MKLLGREIEGYPKAVAIAIAILLVSSGLCGATSTIESRNGWSWLGRGFPNSPVGTLLEFLDLVSLAGIVVSGFGTGLLLFMWPIVTLYRSRYRSSEDKVASLFQQENVVKHAEESEQDEEEGVP